MWTRTSYALILLTKTEFVRILSRAFALYLLAGALLECTYLPQFLYSLMPFERRPCVCQSELLEGLLHT